MTFVNPRVGYTALLNAIKDTLSLPANKADLNYELTYPVKQVIVADPNVVSIPITMLPSVVIWYPRMTEAIHTLPVSGSRRVRMTIQVYCLVVNMQSSPKSDIDCRQLAENVEAVMRKNYRLDESVCWIYPSGTEFDFGEKGGVFLSVGIVELTAEKIVR